MKTVIALALSLVSTACGQMSAVDLASIGVGNAKAKESKTKPVDVVINAPAIPEATPSTTVEPPSGKWRYGALTCDFDRRTCDDGSVLRFDSEGPLLCSASGEITTTGWVDWTQLP